MQAGLGKPRPVALVTGATGGIGTAVTRKLATAGFALSLNGRSGERLEKLASSLSPETAVTSHPVDLTQEGSAERLVAEAIQRHGRLDVLVNNAGISRVGGVLDAAAAAWDQLVTLNLLASMRICHAAMPSLRESPCGCVINISSIGAQTAYAGGEAYSASKAGLLAFGRCLFESVREHGVKVCTILPGYVDTEMVAGRGLDGSRMIQPADVADAISYVLSTSATCCPTELVLRPQRTPVR